MKTKGDCLSTYLRYLDEATKKGVDLPSAKNADYRDKFNYFLDEAQRYIATIVKIPAVFQITQNTIHNQLGLRFDIQQYLPGKDIILSGKGTKSFYFEIDNVGTVQIKVNGIIVKTINNVLKRQFTAYKGNIAANDSDNVEIVFTGSYPYNIRNTALYSYAFPTDDDVPVYSPYISYDMPSNFLEFDTVILRGDERVYQNYISQKWENNKKVILNYCDKGSFDIHYFKYPSQIAYNAPDNTPLEVEDKAIDLVVLQAGIMATAADNPALSSWLRSIFVEKVQNISSNDKITETSVQTIFYM